MAWGFQSHNHRIKRITIPNPMVLHVLHLFSGGSGGGVAFEGETFGRGGERLMGDEAVCIWEKKEEQRRWDCFT
ncbi:hypothetical protein MTR67_011381 [Solanum verrucosum]|uniref:Uncharacterized protein n=1 Tax=Solanum verrucosum TaxID=315347 RepID=A0AAF0QCJ1_SOLVR|nr:hypothetical protein MTR67_011381 [Solanum verrucosum]